MPLYTLSGYSMLGVWSVLKNKPMYENGGVQGTSTEIERGYCVCVVEKNTK